MIAIKWPIGIVLGVALFMLGIVILVPFASRKNEQAASHFETSSINGTLEAVRQSGGFTFFEVHGRTYQFKPYTSGLNENRIFGYFAQPGDSVLKPAFGDTLRLFKNSKEFRYTFKKWIQSTDANPFDWIFE